MPGNVKLGSSSGPDPDPRPYLYVSTETRRTDMNKPYDPKKSVWVPNDEGGFVEAILQADDGKKATENQHSKKFGSPSSKRKKKANKGNANKKLKAKLASLEKELDEKNAASDEDNLTSQIAAAIKDAGSAPPKSDEDKNRSIARSILSITARKK